MIRHGLQPHLLVQGAAGSGKTTIALHRIAYLLYTHQGRLKSENMMILAPNPLFLSYISQVLPDLGVERVIQTTFEGWCRSGMGKQMPKVFRESRLEKNLNLPAEERERIGRLVRKKGSMEMLTKLETWLDQLQERVIPAGIFRMTGVLLMDQQELRDVMLRQFRYYPLQTRIEELIKMLRKRARGAAEKLKKEYGDLAERQIDRILAGMKEGPERQQRIRDIYALRDQRVEEIGEREKAYLQK